MKFLTSFLQDMVILLAVWLGLQWTGLQYELYHGLIILGGFFIYGFKAYKEGVQFGKAHAAYLKPEDFDTWLAMHGLEPHDYAKAIDNESD